MIARETRKLRDRESRVSSTQAPAVLTSQAGSTGATSQSTERGERPGLPGEPPQSRGQAAARLIPRRPGLFAHTRRAPGPRGALGPFPTRRRPGQQRHRLPLLTAPARGARWREGLPGSAAPLCPRPLAHFPAPAARPQLRPAPSRPDRPGQRRSSCRRAAGRAG